MTFQVSYHPEVKTKDLPQINAYITDRIKKVIESRLMVAPHEYGEPLRRTLKGYWKIRVGDYRIVFKVQDHYISILCINHRKDVYQLMHKRK